MAKQKKKKSKTLASLDELYDHKGNVLCRFCAECEVGDNTAGFCQAAGDEHDNWVLLDAAECDSGELVSKELSVLNARLNGRLS